MPENNNKYCYHCMSLVDERNGDFCSVCGKRHSEHYGQSNELPAGTFLADGRYLVGVTIGSGGFGISYIGYDMKLERKILIKETFYSGIFRRNSYDPYNSEPLKVTYGAEFSLDEIMRKTKKECMSLSEGEGLNNIVKVYDWFTENNTAYIITEFIEGVTLFDRVRMYGYYTWDEYYTKLKPLMISLSTLHKKGIIHRDIKPLNIMIRNLEGFGEEFVLIDFGLARSTETKTLASVGVSFSPGYAPYEQRSFTMKDGEYTDVYSLAATSYFALTGQEPELDMAESIEGNFPELRNMSENYGVPENVVKGLSFSLNPNFKQRCQTVDELMRYFDKLNQLKIIKEANKNSPPITKVNSMKSAECVPEKNNVNSDGMRAAAIKENRERAREIAKEAAKQREYDRIIQEAKESIDLPKYSEVKSVNKKPLIIAAVLIVLAIVFAVAIAKSVNKDDNVSGESGYTEAEQTENNSVEDDSVEDDSLNKEPEYLNDKYVKSKIDKYEQEAEELQAAVEEVIEAYRKGDKKKKWYEHTAEEADISDVCIEKDMLSIQCWQTIDDVSYCLVWTADNKIEVSGGIYDDVYGYHLEDDTTIKFLVEETGYLKELTVLEKDVETLNSFAQEVVTAYKSSDTAKTWHGKTAEYATFHDVCVEKGIDDSGDFYERKVNGNTYNIMWTDDDELKPCGEEYYFSGSIIDGDCDIQAYI